MYLYLFDKKHIFVLFYFVLVCIFNISLIVSNHKLNQINIIQPILTSTKSEGGQIYISSLNSFNVSQISAKFTSVILNSDVFYCENIKVLNETSISCYVPKGFGEYIVVIKDSINHAVVFWSFELGQDSINHQAATKAPLDQRERYKTEFKYVAKKKKRSSSIN